MRPFGLLVGLLVVLPAVLACDADYATVEPENPTRAADGLVFTHTDGSTYEIQDGVATCRPAGHKPGLEVVRLTAPADVAGGGPAWPSLVVEVGPGMSGTFELPLERRDPRVGLSDVTLLAPDARAHKTLSGSQDEATGRITIHEAACDPEPRLAIRIDGTLAAAAGRATVRVTGGMASTGG